MKVMKYFAVASLALFAACNNEENPVAPESGNQPVDVVMSVALPGPGTRAAMGELQNTANDQDAASVEKLHVYLVAGEDIVLSKEFTKDTDDFTKLTSATAVGAEATTGGYKFLDVDNGVTKALVIANPQGALVDGEGKTVAEISKQQLKAQINEVIYAGSETLTTVGAEPYGVNPQEDKRTVKKAELTLTASMNRFQVTGTKFVKVIWKDGLQRPDMGRQVRHCPTGQPESMAAGCRSDHCKPRYPDEPFQQNALCSSTYSGRRGKLVLGQDLRRRPL